MAMSELVDCIGPGDICSDNTDFPRPRELSYVPLRDQSDCAIVPLPENPLQLLVVLPTKEAGKTIHADDVQHCRATRESARTPLTGCA